MGLIVDRGCLLRRLRVATAACHAEVEAIVSIATRVRRRDDYVDLLGRFYGLHAGLESRLQEPTWELAWRDVGIEISAHRRAPLLVADLCGLGLQVPAIAPEFAPFATFGAALGCLYVLEGSALGGQVVAGQVAATIGEVPAAFLTGGGRRTGMLWASVRRGLRQYEGYGGDSDLVVAGARATFAAFGECLAMVLA